MYVYMQKYPHVYVRHKYLIVTRKLVCTWGAFVPSKSSIWAVLRWSSTMYCSPILLRTGDLLGRGSSSSLLLLCLDVVLGLLAYLTRHISMCALKYLHFVWLFSKGGIVTGCVNAGISNVVLINMRKRHPLVYACIYAAGVVTEATITVQDFYIHLVYIPLLSGGEQVWLGNVLPWLTDSALYVSGMYRCLGLHCWLFVIDVMRVRLFWSAAVHTS